LSVSAYLWLWFFEERCEDEKAVELEGDVELVELKDVELVELEENGKPVELEEENGKPVELEEEDVELVELEEDVELVELEEDGELVELEEDVELVELEEDVELEEGKWFVWNEFVELDEEEVRVKGCPKVKVPAKCLRCIFRLLSFFSKPTTLLQLRSSTLLRSPFISSPKKSCSLFRDAAVRGESGLFSRKLMKFSERRKRGIHSVRRTVQTSACNSRNVLASGRFFFVSMSLLL